MKTLFLILLCLFTLQLFAPSASEGQKRAEAQSFFNYRLYEQVIENLAYLEGFRADQYNCPAGFPTIGHGHLIKAGEHFGTITRAQADSLLRVDFDASLKLIDSKLDYNKRLALAHFVFNLGIGRYSRSTLKSLVEAGEPVGAELLKWVYYRANGKKRKSARLEEARRFEILIYERL